MKKIWIIMLVMLLVGSAIPVALAEDPAADAGDVEEEVDIDEETQEEVEVMNDTLGATIRLLQLEKSITRNILRGEKVVAFLNDSSYNTSVLEALLVELRLVKDEVTAADPNVSDAVQVFVDLKKDAINISQEFRKTVHDLLDGQTIAALRQEIHDAGNGTLANITRRIRSKVRMFNGRQLGRIFRSWGEANDTVVECYRNGSCTMEQVRENLTKKAQGLSGQMRKQVYSKIKQGAIQKQIHAQQRIANVTEGYHERLQKRIRERLNETQGVAHQFMQQKLSQISGNKPGDTPGFGGGGKSNAGEGKGNAVGPGGPGKGGP